MFLTPKAQRPRVGLLGNVGRWERRAWPGAGAGAGALQGARCSPLQVQSCWHWWPVACGLWPVGFSGLIRVRVGVVVSWPVAVRLVLRNFGSEGEAELALALSL